MSYLDLDLRFSRFCFCVDDCCCSIHTTFSVNLDSAGYSIACSTRGLPVDRSRLMPETLLITRWGQLSWIYGKCCRQKLPLDCKQQNNNANKSTNPDNRTRWAPWCPSRGQTRRRGGGASTGSNPSTRLASKTLGRGTHSSYWEESTSSKARKIVPTM